MTRRTDERSTLRPLLAELADRADRAAADWEQRIDPRVLRRFRRQIDDAGDSMGSSSAGTPAVDRARTVAAEVLVAWRLLESGCSVEHEVEIPAGRHVDFRARRDGATLCVHVKRAPQPTLRDAQVSVPATWRTLETVERGMVVALSLARNLRGKALHAALDQAFDFVEQASVGDECSLRDAEGRPAARLRAIAPSTQRRVELVADLSASFDDHVPRFQATLRKAFAQFMPRSENLIVRGGGLVLRARPRDNHRGQLCHGALERHVLRGRLAALHRDVESGCSGCGSEWPSIWRSARSSASSSGCGR